VLAREGMKPCTLFFALALASCARGPHVNGMIGHSELTSAPEPPPTPREAAATDLELVGGVADLCRTGTSLAVDRADDEALARLARCLVSDEAKPATIVLIGREIGPASFDVDLGLRRAIHVKELLVAGGVPEERIVATSSPEAARPGVARVDLVIAFPPAPRK
jgi:hypothetical protein